MGRQGLSCLNTACSESGRLPGPEGGSTQRGDKLLASGRGSSAQHLDGSELAESTRADEGGEEQKRGRDLGDRSGGQREDESVS